MYAKLKRSIVRILAFINILTILAMIITGFGGYANPVSHSFIAVSTLTFPIFAFINVLFILFWILFKFKFVLIPLTGFIICYIPTNRYFPLNRASEAPTDGIKFLSYNICAFREYDYPEGEDNPTITYLENSNADIICLQESEHGKRIKKLIDKKLDRLYPYKDFPSDKGNGIAILSKFPIISNEVIDYFSKSNRSVAWKVKIDEDTVIIINNHLESYKLTTKDRDKFKKLVKENVKDSSAKEDTKWLYEKLAAATKIRAPQADSIAKYIEKNKGKSMIVCGDFNDNPLSYSRRKIAENLTDCYIEKGHGPGISYHTGGFYVRIDNIMCSDDWEVLKCEVDNKIAASDHYPICAWIKKRYNIVKKDNKSL